jgi:2-amino-4-hydroxy-6-hydroxymethyldihydropteridine diphosphokinase
MASALSRLRSLGPLQRCSSLYSTRPVGIADQPRFLNAVIELNTDLAPYALLSELFRIEKEYGRDRGTGVVNGPRTLDLDILALGNLRVSEPGLEIPHPRLAERAFVLVPLNEIAPDVKIAGHERSVSQLLETLRSNYPDEPDAVVRVESDRWNQSAAGALHASS